VLTVALSWTMVTLVSPCDTPHLHYGSPTEGIAFGGTAVRQGLHNRHDLPGVRHRRTRFPDPAQRAVPRLFSYVYGVVIVAGAINPHRRTGPL